MLFVYQRTHRCVLELYWYGLYVYLSSKAHISLSLPNCGTLQCSTLVWSANLDMASVMGRSHAAVLHIQGVTTFFYSLSFLLLLLLLPPFFDSKLQTDRKYTKEEK